jgi:hypothetical protein
MWSFVDTFRSHSLHTKLELIILGWVQLQLDPFVRKFSRVNYLSALFVSMVIEQELCSVLSIYIMHLQLI